MSSSSDAGIFYSPSLIMFHLTYFLYLEKDIATSMDYGYPLAGIKMVLLLQDMGWVA